MSDRSPAGLTANTVRLVCEATYNVPVSGSAAPPSQFAPPTAFGEGKLLLAQLGDRDEVGLRTFEDLLSWYTAGPEAMHSERRVGAVFASTLMPWIASDRPDTYWSSTWR